MCLLLKKPYAKLILGRVSLYGERTNGAYAVVYPIWTDRFRHALSIRPQKVSSIGDLSNTLC